MKTIVIAHRGTLNRFMAQFSLELRFRVAFLAVLLPLASGACVDLDLGMGRGTIPNSDITASSIQSGSTPAKHGRLNYTSGSSWCAKTSERNPYLQIDLQTLHIICAVCTQGNSQADQWVKTYKLQLSTDGTNWTDYKELGQVKVLEGNKDRNSAVKHVLYGVLTRYVRFVSETQQGGACMRTEVFGVKQKPTCDSQAIGLADGGRIPDDSFSASSIFNSIYAAKYGRLNGRRAWEPKNNNDPTDYLQIDLLNEYVICAVATQGNPPSQTRAKEWTTKYKLRFSLNGTTFFPYNETKINKVFTGNSGKTDTRKNSLKEFASAKFIRFLPTSYHKFKVLRVEAYGILLSKVPSRPPTAFNLTARSSTSIIASWQLPPVFARHGTIVGFKVFYKKKGSDKPARNLTIRGELTLSKNVTGLDKYTEYEFQVLAYSSDGDGPNSSVEVERTMEDAPSRPPSNFRVNGTSSTSVTASWQLPPKNYRNGIIKGFKLFFKKKASSGFGTILSINSEAVLDKVVTGLDIYTEYEFQVLAFTSAGDGVNSSLVVERTGEDVPSQAPSNFTVIASTSSVVTTYWQLPPVDSRNGLIMGFKLFYKKKTVLGSSTMLLMIDGATHHKMVTGLDKYTEYEFQVLAYTSVGDGPKSSPVMVRTMKDGGCVEFYLGMENRTIPDNKVTASSEQSANTPSKNGRLHYTSGSSWCARASERNPYLQIDLRTLHIICAVSTQGNSKADQWVKTYKLQLSTDGTTWTDYKELGQVKSKLERPPEGEVDRNLTKF